MKYKVAVDKGTKMIPSMLDVKYTRNAYFFFASISIMQTAKVHIAATVMSNSSINVPRISIATIKAENIAETAMSFISFFMLIISYQVL